MLLAAQPPAKSYGLIPTDTRGVRLEAAHGGLVIEPEPRELFRGHLGFRHVKAVRNPDFVNRLFIVIAMSEEWKLLQQQGIGGLAIAHPEGSGRYTDHSDTDRVYERVGFGAAQPPDQRQEADGCANRQTTYSNPLARQHAAPPPMASSTSNFRMTQ